MRRTLPLLLGFLSASLLTNIPAWSAPNTDDPLDALATRAEEEVQALSAEATKQYRLAADTISGMVAKMNNNELKKINPKEFGIAWVAMLRMERLGKQLEQWGETAGIDFQKRAAAVKSDFHLVKKEFVKLPEISAKLPQVLKTFNSEAGRRKNNLAAAGKLFQQKKYVEAEIALLKDIDVLEDMSCLLEDTQRGLLGNFGTPLGKVKVELDQIRKEAGKKRLEELIAADPPGFEALLAQMTQAATDLKAGQNPSFDGQQMTGPEFVKAAGIAWRKSQLAALHCAGLYASLNMRHGERGAAPLDELVARQGKFSSQFLTDLGAVIAADAARTSAEQAEAVYVAYLAELAPLATLAAPGAVQKAIEPQLESLVARSAELQANVAAYQAATDDLLRWRRLVADEQQKAVAGKYLAFAPTVANVVRAPHGSEVGLLIPTSDSTAKLALLAPLPLVIERMKTDLVGKPVLIESCVGIVPAKKLVASHYRDRHYATFTLPAGVDIEQMSLKADLLVSDNAPPLTLNAAMAVTASDRGDLQAAGVVLNKLYVEPFATRMATLPAAASAMMPLGPLERETMDAPALHQVLLRSDVQPDWVRNEYYFVGAN